ncbi:MAG: hypothetical protein RSB54_00050 [Bacilli bacterium]
MKKVLLILLVVGVLSGCTVERIDKYNYVQTMNKILPLEVKSFNNVGKGYKYYAPMGVIKMSSSDYNDILKSGNNRYYLYVDVVSYYYKTDFKFKPKDTYYSKEIKINDKKGYLEITKIKDKLYVEMMYNYAKIETYVNKKELNDTIRNLSYILTSVKFNESLLNKIYEEGNFNSKEEVYNIFETKEKEGNFLDYINEYDKYEEKPQAEESEIKVETQPNNKPETSSTK